jgi:hypothetical protein
MAKRTRYPGRPVAKPGAKRPGTATRPGSSSAIRTTEASRIGGLTEAEVERAAQIEKELVAREQAAIAENARRRARTSGRVDVSLTGDAGQPLSVRAAHEYAYVARDVKRIVVTGSVMMGILAAIWVIVNLGGVAAS